MAGCPTQAAFAWVGLTFALSIADRSTGRGPFHEREQRQQPHPNVERHDVRVGHAAATYGFASLINWATFEPVPTGSTKTICLAFRYMRSGPCSSLPRFTNTFVTCLLSGLVLLRM